MKSLKSSTVVPLKRQAPQPPRPPKGLSSEARHWWKCIQAEYDITDSAGLLLLQTAAEQFQRMRAEEAIIDRDGSVIVDRFNQRKQHPAVLNAREARSAMLKCLHALNLDLEPLQGRVGRPAGR